MGAGGLVRGVAAVALLLGGVAPVSAAQAESGSPADLVTALSNFPRFVGLPDSASLQAPLVLHGTIAQITGAVMPGAQVLLSAWPTNDEVRAMPNGGTFELTPIARAVADASGAYELRAGVTDVLRSLAGPDGIDIELDVRALTTPNITYLGAVTVWPRNRDSIGETGQGFPDESMRVVHPAFGAVIPAAETAFRFPGEDKSRPIWVQAGFRLTSGKVGAVNDVEVTYTADGKTKRQRSGKSMIVCMAPCPDTNKFRNLDDWEHAIRDKLGVTISDTPAAPAPTRQPRRAPSPRSAGPGRPPGSARRPAPPRRSRR